MPNLQQKARWNDKELPENIEQEWNAIIDVRYNKSTLSMNLER